ncbi:hypothetical protein MMC17_008491 [Xylographa soralifera]|nr:hypothetical protein [Xylographa soralifera]
MSIQAEPDMQPALVRSTTSSLDARMNTFGDPEHLEDSLICSFEDCTNISGFRSKAELERHKAKHIRPYACSVETCDIRPFGDKAGLARHIREHHGIGDAGQPAPDYPCPVTSCRRNKRSFRRRWNMLEHYRKSHEAQKPQRKNSDVDLNTLSSDDTASESDKLARSRTVLIPLESTGEGSSTSPLRESVQKELALMTQQRAALDEKITTFGMFLSRL